MQVRGPDGAIVNFPDGTPQATVHQAMLNHYRAYMQGQSQGAGSGVVDTLNRSIPGFSELGAGLETMGRAGDQLIAGQPVDLGADWQASRQRQQGSVDQLQRSHPIVSSMTKGVGLAAQVAPALMTGGATAAPAVARGVVPKIAAVGTRVARNAVTGAGIAGVNAFAQPGTLSQRVQAADNALPGGAVLGAAVPEALGVAGKTVNAFRGGTDLTTPAGRLAAEKVPLTPGQNLGGAFKATESKLTSAPILGDAITGAMRRGQDGFNRAVANRALGPIGETLPADVPVGNDAVAHVSDRLGAAYKDAESKIVNPVPLTDFQQAIASRATSLRDAPSDVQDQFAKTIQTRALEPLLNGSGSGAQLGKVVSDLRDKASDMISDGGHNADLGRALNGTASDLQTLAGKYNPDYAEAKGAADQGWANFVRMRQAAQMRGAKGGRFTPAQLKMAVRSTDDSVGNGASAKGDALLYRLADDGEQTMGTVPDSGTAGRMMVNGALLGLNGHPLTATVATPATGALGVASLPYFAINRGAANAFANADPAAAAAGTPTQAVTAANGNAFIPKSITALQVLSAAQQGQQQDQPNQ